MLGQTDLTSLDMRKVVMQTEELVSTIGATERLVEILEITHAKSDLEKVSSNATQMNY